MGTSCHIAEMAIKSDASIGSPIGANDGVSRCTELANGDRKETEMTGNSDDVTLVTEEL